MPTSHRRIGLVVDEPVDSVLQLYRDQEMGAFPEATIARKAVVGGGLIEAMVKVASGQSADRERAVEFITGLKGFVPDLPLSREIKDELMESLNRAQRRPSLAERRRRQFALLEGPEDPPGHQTAQDLADTFDAFERQPSR